MPTPGGTRLTRFRWERELMASDLPAIARLVGFTLATHVSSKTGTAYPSTRVLAVKSGLDERSVMKYIDLLVARGWIYRHRNAGAGKAWKLAVYEITLPAASHAAPTGTEGTASHAAPSQSEGIADASQLRALASNCKQAEALHAMDQGTARNGEGTASHAVKVLHDPQDNALSAQGIVPTTCSYQKERTKDFNREIAPDGANPEKALRENLGTKGNGESKTAHQEQDPLERKASELGLFQFTDEGREAFAIRVARFALERTS